MLCVFTLLLPRSYTPFATWHTRFVLCQPLVDAEVQQPQELTSRVGNTWVTLKWKPTLWVYWMVCHSACVLRMHPSMHIFSSIPTEHHNSKFKVGIKNSTCGRWSLPNLRLSKRTMYPVVNMETLDVGLLMHEASKGEGVALVARKKGKR